MYPSALESARDLLRRGWMPLPIPFGEKNPGRAGWQNFTVTEAHLPKYFNGKQQNIGVVLGEKSGGRVDVDLDCAEAIKLAPHFLPQTGAIFGRASRRRSHWEYIAAGAQTAQFAGLDGTMLVELRSTGAQTIFPGSTHKETGERIEWDEDGEPMLVEISDLRKRVGRLAAAAILARHWPAPAPGESGGRHHASLALGGGLLRARWTEEETARFIEAVCMGASDEETRSRVRNVVSTKARLANGQQVTGWTTLAQIVGAQVVDRVCEWLEIHITKSEAPNKETAKTVDAQAADVALLVVRMSDVKPETVRWLWHPYIAYGKLTILEGDPGLGKSWITCALASAVTNGRGLPSSEPFEAGNVLMLTAEDGLGDTLRPRLDAVGADVSRVLALAQPMTFDTVGLIRLEAAIIEHAPSLVSIDPWFGFTGSKVDIHRANECRAISAPLAAIAERCGCAIVAVRHLGKSHGGGHALNAGIGSIDFAAAARSVLLVGADPDDLTRRAMVQTKNNLAPQGGAIGYTLEGGQFYWTGGSDLTAGRILAAASDEEERGALTEAVDFLRTALSSGGRDNKSVKYEAKQAGISEATLRRAKDRLGVRVRHIGVPGSPNQQWVWELPKVEDAQVCAEGAQAREVEHLRTSGGNKDSYNNDLPEDAQHSEVEHLRADDQDWVREHADEIAERAAIMEVEGGLSREEAERRAREWYAPTPF